MYNGTAVAFREHKEWFWVWPEVAINSVERWKKFVERAYTPYGTIMHSWAALLRNNLTPAGLEEINAFRRRWFRQHHELRNKTLNDWLKEGFEKQGPWEMEHMQNEYPVLTPPTASPSGDGSL